MYLAASELVDGHRNTVFGYGAMGDIVGAAAADGSSDNTYIGFESGGDEGTADSAGTSDKNTGVGAYTLHGALNSGGSNTAVGYGASAQLTTGDRNTTIGMDSGKALLGSYDNVFVGANTGETLLNGSGNTLIGHDADVDTNSDFYQTKIGSFGIIKYKTARMTITKAHSGDNTVVAQVCKIPALSIIHRVTATVITKSNLSTYILNLSLSTTDGSSADAALVNASTTITVPEILGAGGVATYAQNSATVLGTAADIVASSGATNKTVYTTMPTTTIVGTADTFLYICNAGTGNGTTDSNNTVIDICVEYQGTD